MNIAATYRELLDAKDQVNVAVDRIHETAKGIRSGPVKMVAKEHTIEFWAGGESVAIINIDFAVRHPWNQIFGSILRDACLDVLFMNVDAVRDEVDNIIHNHDITRPF